VRRESYEISLSELRAEIDKGNVEYRPVTEPGAGPEPVGGDADALASRARGLQALQVREDIYKDRVTALLKDPAGAVEKRAARAAEGLGGAALVGARLQAQAADGLAAPKRKALTAAEAEALAGQWRAADTATRLTMFRDLEQVYGAQAGRVMGELGLNPLEELAARRAFDDPALAARTLPEISAAAADSNKLPTVDGFERLKKEVLAESKTLLAMRDMLLKVMPGNSDAAGKVRAAEDAAGRLLQMYGGNKKQTLNALDKGLGKLDGDRFALLYFTAQVNGSALEEALGTAAWRRLKDFGEALPGYAQDMPVEERADFLRRKGIWANAPDGDGWVLFDARAQAPIINERGEYFRVRPGEVGALSTGRARTPADENLVWE
jgi:hypothetical protein